MKKLALPESHKPPQFAADCWFDEASIPDMDYFVKTLTSIKAKGVRPDLIGSITTHYACKFLPELTTAEEGQPPPPEKGGGNQSPETVTSSWTKKRFFVETLVGILPPERDSIHCNFLLRLLRTANMVGAEAVYRAELEKRVSWQLDQASLKELMIPAFSHTCGTLLDVELVVRLVKRFVGLDEGIRSGSAAMVKVAKLVDGYLAEAALDGYLTLPEFVELAGALPGHARSTDDGLYRAIDTYLKVHQALSKEERKSLCKLMDTRKLSVEASHHAAQNERLPMRAVLQVLFSEQTKLNRQCDWNSGSFSETYRSPNFGLESSTRCQSKREVAVQHLELQRLKDDVLRLQSQCLSMQGQIDRLQYEKKKGLFKWKKLVAFAGVRNGVRNGGEGEIEFGRQTPKNSSKQVQGGRNTPKNWRMSAS